MALDTAALRAKLEDVIAKDQALDAALAASGAADRTRAQASADSDSAHASDQSAKSALTMSIRDLESALDAQA